MKNTRLGLILMDALCAGVLAAGAALVLLPAAGLTVSPGLLAVCVPLTVGLTAVCEKRPWIPPAVLVLGALIVLAVAGLLGRTGELGAAVSGYALRAWDETSGGSPRFIVYLLAVLPVSIACWTLVRLGDRFRLGPLWAAALLCGGLIGFKAVCMPEGWLAPFLLLCAGFILFLPRASLGAEGRLQAQILAALLALPVLGLALLLGPRTDGQWRSETAGYLVQDIQDLWEYRWGDLPPLPVTSMRSMGLQPQQDRLGGDRELSDTPVLISSQDLLLRGQALEVYTGSRWEDSAEVNNGNFRFESVFWQGRRRDAFGLRMPRDTGGTLPKDVMTGVDADLRAYRNFRSLFLPYRPETVDIGREVGVLYFNMQGEAYWDRAPKNSAEYRVQGSTWALRDPDFDKNMLFLEKALTHYGEDPGLEEARERCLQLPETLPGWVGDLALELTEDRGSPYARAAALRDWLGDNCEYTLTPGPADPEEDFVAGFLTRRRGYCTYYASALTVLCRCAGVPARYVTGYGMTPDGQRYKATQATAHAWTEIYLENIGWVPVDALSPEIFREETPLPEESQSGDAGGGAPAAPSPTPFVGTGDQPEAVPESGGFNPAALLWLIPIALIAAVLPASRALRRRRYSPGYVRRRFPLPGPAAEHCYGELMRLLRILELDPEPGETLLAFWLRAAERLPEGTDWQDAGRIMDRLRFGDMPPGPEEIEFLCGCREALARHILSTQGILRRLRV